MAVKNIKKNINGKDSERFGKIRILSFKYLKISEVNVFFICSIFLFFSCESEDSTYNLPQTSKTSLELDEKLCTDFAIKMHTSIMNADSTFINNYIDWSQLIKKDSTQSKLTAEILSHLKMKTSIGSDLIQEVLNGGHLKFITYYEEDNKHFVVLRMYEEPQTINYLEFSLGVSNDRIVINDVYDYNKSQHFSGLVSDYVDYYESFGEHWREKEQENSKIQDSVHAIVSTGDLKKAVYELIKLDYDYSKTLMFDNMEDIFLNSGNREMILSVLNDKVNRIPITEKGRWLSLFYMNAFQGKYQDALIALANIESNVGSDGVLVFLKGNMHFELYEYLKALDLFNDAIAYNPNVYTFHFAKVLCLIEINDYDQAVESLLVMDDYFDVKSVSWETEFKDYAGFLQSEQYRKWKERILN